MGFDRTVRVGSGVTLGCAVVWLALQMGGVAPIDFYPIFIGLILLFLISIFKGMRIEWWGWLLLFPLALMFVNRSTSFELLKYVTFCLGINLGVWQMQNDWISNKRVSPMILIFLTGGIFVALYGLAKSLMLLAAQQKIPAFPMGTFYSRNHFAGFLELILPLSLMIGFAMLDGRRKSNSNLSWNRFALYIDHVAISWIFLLSAALYFIAILFSLSRGGTTSVVIGASVAMLFYFRRNANKHHLFAVALVSILIIILIVIGALWIGIQPIVERVNTIPQYAEERNAIWDSAIWLIHNYPIVGVGAGLFGWARTGNATNHLNDFVELAHNDYLQAAAEWGVLAAFVFFGVIIYFTWNIGRACLHVADPLRAGLLAGILGGDVALLVHSFVDYNLHVPSNILLFGLLIGSGYGIATACTISSPEPQKTAIA